MTLKFSVKSFRKVIWKADQESWARLHDEAFRTFGGSVEYVVHDNLKQGVIRPDLYEPAINPVYAAMLAHYGSYMPVGDTRRTMWPRAGRLEADYQSPCHLTSAGDRKTSVVCAVGVEVFHKILESGCQSEQSKLRTAKRLVNLLGCSAF